MSCSPGLLQFLAPQIFLPGETEAEGKGGQNALRGREHQ